MGTPEAIQEDVRWPADQARTLASACGGLAELLDAQSATRWGAASRASEQFVGNKATEFTIRFDTNSRNADGLAFRLHAMRTALAAAEQWATEEQAARLKARDEQDDRSWWGLKGLFEDLVG